MHWQKPGLTKTNSFFKKKNLKDYRLKTTLLLKQSQETESVFLSISYDNGWNYCDVTESFESFQYWNIRGAM